MPEITVHLPEPLEPQVLARTHTPRIGDELPDGYVVVRRRVTDEDSGCEVWVAPIGAVSGTSGGRPVAGPDQLGTISSDGLVVELAAMLRGAGLDGQAEALEDAHARGLAITTDDRNAILAEIRASSDRAGL